MRSPASRLAPATLLCILLLAGPAAAQDAPAARPQDVESIDAVIAALYDVISGPAGQKRDWQRFHSLFIPGARLIPTGVTQQGDVRHRVMTPDDYIATSGSVLEERGFFEREIGRTTERFGNIAHVFSAYDSKNTAEDPEPFARGINSIQLLHDGTRWWVVTIYWDSERADNPIPDRYLRTGGSSTLMVPTVFRVTALARVPTPRPVAASYRGRGCSSARYEERRCNDRRSPLPPRS